MALRENIENFVGNALDWAGLKRGAVDQPSAWMMDFAEMMQHTDMNLGTRKKQLELYARLVWVSTAVSRVAEVSAGTPFEVFQLDGEQETAVKNHEFEILLRNPNPLMTRGEFLQTIVAHYRLAGNAYIWMNKASEFDQPAEMWIIPPNMIKPVPDKRSFLLGYIYNFGGREIPLEVWEVAHFKQLNPMNQFIGLSAVEQIAIVATGDISGQKYNTNFFGKENAKMPGFLAFADTFTPSDWAKLKAETVKEYGGTKRGLLMLQGTGHGDVKWIPAAMTQKDMEFLGGRKFTKEEIWHWLAPGLASKYEPNATEASAKVGADTFLSDAVWPIHQILAERLTKDVLSNWGDNLVGKFQDVRPKDMLLDLKKQEAFERTHTVQETRMEWYGDDPLGDERDDKIVTTLGRQEAFDLQAFGDVETAEDTGAKANERRQFHDFAAGRVKEGKRDAITKFKFIHLEMLEQEALKAQYLNGADPNEVFAELVDGLADATKALRETASAD